MRQYTSQSLTKEQKTGFILLLTFCLLAIGLGFLQVRNTLYGPFVIRSASTDDGSTLYVDETVRLQSIDTDQDGLNNYEELYFYETSPYLPDTDSDGIEDREEINSGTDPLCREGDTCVSEEQTDVAAVEENALEFNGTDVMESSPVELLLPPEEVKPDTDFTEITQSPDEIRALLLQTGNIKKEDLDQIKDEQLMIMVQEILQQEE
jgi:hypothetical protein